MEYLEDQYEVRSDLVCLLSPFADPWNSSGPELMNGALGMTSQYGGGISPLNPLGGSEPLPPSEESGESLDMWSTDRAQLTELTPVKNVASLHQSYSQTGDFGLQESDETPNNFSTEEKYYNPIFSSPEYDINCPGMEYEYPEGNLFHDEVTPGVQSSFTANPPHESLELAQSLEDYQELMTTLDAGQLPKLGDLSLSDNASQQFQEHQLQEAQEFGFQYLENPSPPSYVLNSPNCSSPYYDNSSFTDVNEQDWRNQTSLPSSPPVNNSCIGDFHASHGIEDWLKEIRVGKNHRPRGPRCWEFLLRLLKAQSSNPSLIKWEDESVGSFRLVEKEKIAKIWGMRQSKKKRSNIKYESFARILRYHYKKGTGMVQPVSEKHLVYKFCPKVMKDFHSGRIL